MASQHLLDNYFNFILPNRITSLKGQKVGKNAFIEYNEKYIEKSIPFW